MKRVPCLAANWKMHKTVAEATAFASGLRAALGDTPSVEVVVAPTFTCLPAVSAALEGSSIALSAQDVATHDQGAYTGEVSGGQLRDVGCSHVIIGHSERRQYYGETDAVVHEKLSAALRHGLVPILCVGETLADREAGATESVVVGQLDAALGSLGAEALRSVIVAYEPVWAIGTGRTATPKDAQDVHAAIRARIRATKGAPLAEGMRVIYGGSVKPDNAAQLLAEPDIDGALVGGASLEVTSFASIVRSA